MLEEALRDLCSVDNPSPVLIKKKPERTSFIPAFLLFSETGALQQMLSFCT